MVLLLFVLFVLLFFTVVTKGNFWQPRSKNKLQADVKIDCRRSLQTLSSQCDGAKALVAAEILFINIPTKKGCLKLKYRPPFPDQLF